MMQNLGDTLVCELRLGDQVWSHGVELGTVVKIELDPQGNALKGRAHVGIEVVAWGDENPGRTGYTFLLADHVHVGSSFVTAGPVTT